LKEIKRLYKVINKLERSTLQHDAGKGIQQKRQDLQIILNQENLTYCTQVYKDVPHKYEENVHSNANSFATLNH